MRILLSLTFATMLFVVVVVASDNTLSSEQEQEQVSSFKHLPEESSSQLDSIVLGAGCFWGVEKRNAAIDGVVDAISGYADGRGFAPTYKAITQYQNKFNPDNYAEVVKVVFDRSRVSLETLLMHYFETHDPTQLNRQGNDVGTQYRSTILTNSPEQYKIAERIKARYQVLLEASNYGAIKTVIKPLTQFHPAEVYHQDYLKKNPNGYCPDHSTGVRFERKSSESKRVDNTNLMKGKHIIVIDSEGYCPYCEKLKENVLNAYQGSIPLVLRYAKQLHGLDIKTPTWATPTVLFLEGGREVFGHQGYMTPKSFYQALGRFKLGETEAYDVAFNSGTDQRFCRQYDIFKNTGDGVFVDKLSGAPLFDTRHRFNSGTGWLSFTQAVEGSVIEKEDKSYGLNRVEIRSKSSNIHLGHVFPDGPNGLPRYCINATVLEFVPRG